MTYPGGRGEFEFVMLPDSMVTVMLCLKSQAIVGYLAIQPRSDLVIVNRGRQVSHVGFSEDLGEWRKFPLNDLGLIIPVWVFELIEGLAHGKGGCGVEAAFLHCSRGFQ